MKCVMFLPASTAIQSGSEPPKEWMLVLHGIYGRGSNWRTFARKLCERKPHLGILLVDLRMHGASMGAPPPHSIEACARDVVALIDDQAKQDRTVTSILGHSFGGKVALDVRRLWSGLASLWIIDSSPSSRPLDQESTVRDVLAMLKSLPVQFATREDFVARVKDKGFRAGLAQWLAMNLEAHDGGYRNALDLNAIKELLDDYWQRDLWPSVVTPGSELTFVIASRDSAVSDTDAQRLRQTAGVTVHTLEGGHWLHVDAQEGLLSLLG